MIMRRDFRGWHGTRALAILAGLLATEAPGRAQSSASPPSNAQVPTPAPLTGPAAWQTLIGNTIVADTRAGSYTEYFTADGTVLHLDKDGRATGKWSLQADKVCFDFPEDDDRICNDLEVEGAQGAFIDQDGGRDAFAILPGNAKKL